MNKPSDGPAAAGQQPMDGKHCKCRKAEDLVDAKIKEIYNDPLYNPSKPKPYYKSLGFLVIMTIFIISTTGTIILWGTDAWNTMLLKVLTLEDNGWIYGYWKKPDIDTKIKIYPFNYTNINDIGPGVKPQVTEIGPYVFRERIERINVVFDQTGETLTYQENRTHEFVDYLSNGSLDDIVYTPNVPFISAAAVGAEQNIITQIALSAILRGLDTRPFLPVDLEGFAMGFDDSFSFVARKISAVLKGKSPPKFGLLNSRSGQSKEQVTIGSGIPDLDNLGVVHAFDGKTHLDYWATDECNSITGSDGSIFPGNALKRSNRLHIYVNNFCRRLPIEFYGEFLETQGFPTKRFRLPDNVYASPAENPENSCYCSGDICPPAGTFHTGICNFGAPMLVSFPHFLHGNPELLKNVTGLNPDYNQHSFYMDLHETFGILLGGNTRFQVNVAVRHCPLISQLNVIPDGTLLPIAWVDVEIGGLRGELNEILYHATYTASYLYYALAWSSLLLCLFSASRLIAYILKRS